MRNIIKIKKNKKGAIGILIFFIVLAFILVIGFAAVIIWGSFNIASDTITPIMTNLGMAGDTNLSEASEYGFGTANTFIEAIPWVISLGFVMALIFTLVFVYIVGFNPHPAFMAFYIALMILLIFLCIVVSNVYQDIYTGTDDLSTRLQEQTTMSYLILNSPFVMTFIAIIGGIIMFTRQVSSEGGSYGV